MLESILDYKYVRKNILSSEGGQARPIIDAEVAGTRVQKKLMRAVDQFYTRELEGVYGTVLSDSIGLEWPLPLDSDIPRPQLSAFVDAVRLEELSSGLEDVFVFTGGEDPDYEECLKAQTSAIQALADAQNGALRDYNEREAQIRQEYARTRQRLAEERELIDEEFQHIGEQRTAAEEQADEEFEQAEKQLDAELSVLNKKKQEGEITAAEWNEGLVRIQDERYDARTARSGAYSDAELEYNQNYAEWQNLLRGNDLDGKTAEKTRDDDILSAQELMLSVDEEAKSVYDEEMNRIYLASNERYGSQFVKNRKALERQLAGLSCYVAADHVDKTAPWIPKSEQKNYTYYNDRVFADWDKCVWKKCTGYSVDKTVPGGMENYVGYWWTEPVPVEPYGTLPGYGVNVNFMRFSGGDQIAWSRKYTPDPPNQQESTWTYDQYFDFRLGDRHQMDAIEEVKAVVKFTGEGEGDWTKNIGYVYGTVDLERIGVQASDWLDRRDQEDDRHQSELNRIDDDYLSSTTLLKFNYDLSCDDLVLSCMDQIDELSAEAFRREQQETLSWINGIQGVIETANRKKEAGEDNTAELQQISNSKADHDRNIAEIEQEAAGNAVQALAQLNLDLSAAQIVYQEALSALETGRKDALSVENDLYRETLGDIQEEYDAERLEEEDGLQAEYDLAVSEAQAALDSFREARAESRRQMNASLVGTWNQHFDEDKRLPEGYDIMSGYPDPGNETDRQWAFDNIRMPAHSWEAQMAQQEQTAEDAYDTATARAWATLQEKLEAMEIYDPEKRELWRADMSNFQQFIERFSDEPGPGSGAWAERSVGNIEVLAVFIKLNDSALTGYPFPDYESEDADL